MTFRQPSYLKGKPTIFLIAVSLKDISLLVKSEEMGEHIQSNVLAGQIAGICSEKSILLIGLIPLSFILRCIFVATVPGDRLITRILVPFNSS